jgi:hypothetical protein
MVQPVSSEAFFSLINGVLPIVSMKPWRKSMMLQSRVEFGVKSREA